MNYIKKLQLEKQESDERIKELEDKINDLRSYVNSDKFNSECELNGYVHKKDILLRLEDN